MLSLLSKCDVAEQFLVIKSAFIVLQILIDTNQTDAARSILNDLLFLRSMLEKVQDMKHNYSSDYIYVVLDNSDGNGKKVKQMPKKQQDQKLQIEFFSVLIGSYLKQFAKSPKNPCLEEYNFALSYYETLINQKEDNLKKSEESLKEMEKHLQSVLSRTSNSMATHEHQMNSHCQAIYFYTKARQDLLMGNYQSAIQNLSLHD